MINILFCILPPHCTRFISSGTSKKRSPRNPQRPVDFFLPSTVTRSALQFSSVSSRNRFQNVHQPVCSAVPSAVQPTVPAVSIVQLLSDVQLQPAAPSLQRGRATGVECHDVHQHQRARTAAAGADCRTKCYKFVDGKRKCKRTFGCFGRRSNTPSTHCIGLRLSVTEICVQSTGVLLNSCR